MFSRFATIH